MPRISHGTKLGHYYGAELPICQGACRHYFRNTTKNKPEGRRMREPRYRACLAAGMQPVQVDHGKGHHGSHDLPDVPPGSVCAVKLIMEHYGNQQIPAFYHQIDFTRPVPPPEPAPKTTHHRTRVSKRDRSHRRTASNSSMSSVTQSRTKLPRIASATRNTLASVGAPSHVRGSHGHGSHSRHGSLSSYSSFHDKSFTAVTYTHLGAAGDCRRLSAPHAMVDEDLDLTFALPSHSRTASNASHLSFHGPGRVQVGAPSHSHSRARSHHRRQSSGASRGHRRDLSGGSLAGGFLGGHQKAPESIDWTSAFDFDEAVDGDLDLLDVPGESSVAHMADWSASSTSGSHHSATVAAHSASGGVPAVLPVMVDAPPAMGDEADLPMLDVPAVEDFAATGLTPTGFTPGGVFSLTSPALSLRSLPDDGALGFGFAPSAAPVRG